MNNIYENAVEVARRTMTLFFVVDTSGSMGGSKIGTLNSAIEEVIPEIRKISGENADAAIKIAVLDFSSGAHWITPAPIDAESFADCNGNLDSLFEPIVFLEPSELFFVFVSRFAVRKDAAIKIAVLDFSSGAHWITPAPIDAESFCWNYLDADGLTDFGEMCKMLNEKLSRNAFMRDVANNGFLAARKLRKHVAVCVLADCNGNLDSLFEPIVGCGGNGKHLCLVHGSGKLGMVKADVSKLSFHKHRCFPY